MKIKQFLTNTENLNSIDVLKDRSQDDHLKYPSDKVIGRPQRTKKYSVAELEKDGMVGVYKEMGLREWLAYRWLLLKNSYRRKFIYKLKY